MGFFLNIYTLFHIWGNLSQECVIFDNQELCPGSPSTALSQRNTAVSGLDIKPIIVRVFPSASMGFGLAFIELGMEKWLSELARQHPAEVLKY